MDHLSLPEDFLHFVWKAQAFVSKELRTTAGETLTLFSVGTHNHNAGADFEAARLRVGTQEWFGNVEIHHKASEWEAHGHHKDPNYNAVILHVVWKADQVVRREDGTLMPTLELAGRIPKRMMLRYEEFLNTSAAIPCAPYFASVSLKTKAAALEFTLKHRLNKKSAEVLELLEGNKGNWEETFYQILAKSYGFKTNATAFLSLAKGLPLKVLQKHRTNNKHLEALLLGQSGLLDDLLDDPYGQELKREYNFLSQKYQLQHTRGYRSQWKFSRVRPQNAPLVRILQFGSLMQQQQLLFSTLLETKKIKDVLSLFEVKVPEFWKGYFTPFPQMGRATRENILINALIPTLWAYGERQGRTKEKEKARAFLEAMKPEKNSILRLWEDLDVPLNHAGNTQAALELKNSFCQKRQCLQCPIGQEVLHRKEDQA